MSADKPPLRSKKWTLAVLGLAAIVLLAVLGRGDPSAYGAIGLIVSVACGGQAAVDYRAGAPRS
jgi:hypothetical protein